MSRPECDSGANPLLSLTLKRWLTSLLVRLHKSLLYDAQASGSGDDSGSWIDPKDGRRRYCCRKRTEFDSVLKAQRILNNLACFCAWALFLSIYVWWPLREDSRQC